VYLVDSNIWLEYLLGQEKYDEVLQFLSSIDDDKLYITDFTVFSIGIILNRFQKNNDLKKFIRNTFEDGEVNLISIDVTEIDEVVDNIIKFNLDFDDAYHLTIALRYNLTLISFDTDFDKTSVTRKTPNEVS
jgi:predicted nucleic acid-binding protein